MTTECPDPIGDPEGYALWVEANTEECTRCGGAGEVTNDTDYEVATCPRCDGTGHVDPIVPEDEP